MKSSIFKLIKNNIFGFLIGIIITSGISVMAINYAYSSNQVSYNDSDVKSALDDLYNLASNSSNDKSWILSDGEIPKLTSNVVELSWSPNLWAAYHEGIYRDKDAYTPFSQNYGNGATGFISSGYTYYQYKFNSPIAITRCIYTIYGTGGNLSNIKIEASNDNLTFVTLYEKSTDSTPGSLPRYIEFDNNNSYTYYRLSGTLSISSGYYCFGYIQMFL